MSRMTPAPGLVCFSGETSVFPVSGHGEKNKKDFSCWKSLFFPAGICFFPVTSKSLLFPVGSVFLFSRAGRLQEMGRGRLVFPSGSLLFHVDPTS